MTTQDKRTEQGAEAAVRFVMSNADGRRFVSDVLDLCHHGRSPYATDPTDLAFNVGRQESARLVLERVERLQPELAEVMRSERRARMTERANRGGDDRSE